MKLPLLECTAEVGAPGWCFDPTISISSGRLWFVVFCAFLGQDVFCRLTHRVLHRCCHAWKNGVWQGCFPSDACSCCIVIHMDRCFPGYVTFLPNRSILSLDLYFSVISPKLSINGGSSIIYKVTIKASGLIWGSGPPLQFSLTIVLNPLMLQRNRTFIRWGIGGQGADNHFYCR